MNVSEVQEILSMIKGSVFKIGSPIEVSPSGDPDLTDIQVGDLFITEVAIDDDKALRSARTEYEVYGVRSSPGGSPHWDDPPDEWEVSVGQFQTLLEAISAAVSHTALEYVRNKTQDDQMYKEYYQKIDS